tara:strand:- start:91 stop:282 length:192 start_codon:yes stop_codon:yes gene_type:complete
MNPVTRLAPDRSLHENPKPARIDMQSHNGTFISWKPGSMMTCKLKKLQSEAALKITQELTLNI